MKNFFTIEYQNRSSKARRGVVFTKHGAIETPAFVPVATQASLKSLSSEEIAATKTQIAFVNTYHLHLRPGEAVIGELGGVHAFMNYDRPLMSDSGGFQVFSLGYGLEHGVGKISNIFPEENRRPEPRPGRGKTLCKIDAHGVTFQSHLDGKILRLTPQISIQIQEKLGADIALALDECTSPLSPKSYVVSALKRTNRWAIISLAAHKMKNQALLGIVQGGHFPDLRQKAGKFMSQLPFDGFAIGGDFGRNKKEMGKIVGFTISLLPHDKLRHILGIGEIDDIFNIVEQGADMFDCVMPTRLGRMGHVLTISNIYKFRYDITKTIYQEDMRPLEEGCDCWVCQNYSRAYVHHLFKTRELLGYRLATFHNVFFLNHLVGLIRESIKENRLPKLKKLWLG